MRWWIEVEWVDLRPPELVSGPLTTWREASKQLNDWLIEIQGQDDEGRRFEEVSPDVWHCTHEGRLVCVLRVIEQQGGIR